VDSVDVCAYNGHKPEALRHCRCLTAQCPPAQCRILNARDYTMLRKLMKFMAGGEDNFVTFLTILFALFFEKICC